MDLDGEKPIDWEKEILQNWWKLDLAPDEFGEHRDVVLSAVRQDGLALRYASDELRNDWYVVAEAVCRDGEALKFASEELRADVKLATWAMGCAIQSQSATIQGTPEGEQEAETNIEEWTGADYSEYNELATSRVSQPNAMRHVCEEMRSQDVELMLHAIKFKWLVADYVLPPLRESKNFWRRVIQQDEATGWIAFGNYAPVVVREDKPLMLLAIKADALALRFAGPGLQKSRDFIMEVVRTDWRALRAAPQEFRADIDILLEASLQDLGALDFAAGDIGKFAIKAVRPQIEHKVQEAKEWTGLSGGEEEEERQKHQAKVKEDWRQLLLDLTETNGRAFSLAKVSGVDRDLTEKAIKKNGRALAYAEDNFREDRELVNESVRTNIGMCSGLLWRTQFTMPEEEEDDVEEKVKAPKSKAKSKRK